MPPEIFDEAGIPVLLIGNSAANNVYGYETTVPVTVDDLIPLVRAVTRSAKHALVVADLPFGSYQGSPTQALGTATRFMKEALALAVKLEGGRAWFPRSSFWCGPVSPSWGTLASPSRASTCSGLPHSGSRGRRRRPGRGCQRPGTGRCLLRAHGDDPRSGRRRGHRVLHIPTIGIGAGPSCDAQVLVWQDMAGLRGSKAPRFVKRYADLRSSLGDAARTYASDVAGGNFPAAEHPIED
jgi:3-methyl-2-oxobutanoate hydroxymethyltransferase